MTLSCPLIPVLLTLEPFHFTAHSTFHSNVRAASRLFYLQGASVPKSKAYVEMGLGGFSVEKGLPMRQAPCVTVEHSCAPQTPMVLSSSSHTYRNSTLETDLL